MIEIWYHSKDYFNKNIGEVMSADNKLSSKELEFVRKGSVVYTSCLK